MLAPQLAVYEIRNPTEEESWSRNERPDINRVQQGEPMTHPEDQQGDDHTQHATVAGHATLVDRQEIPEWERVGKPDEQVGVVEERVPKTATKQDPEDDVDHHVTDGAGLHQTST